MRACARAAGLAGARHHAHPVAPARQAPSTQPQSTHARGAAHGAAPYHPASAQHDHPQRARAVRAGHAARCARRAAGPSSPALRSSPQRSGRECGRSRTTRPRRDPEGQLARVGSAGAGRGGEAGDVHAGRPPAAWPLQRALGGLIRATWRRPPPRPTRSTSTFTGTPGTLRRKRTREPPAPASGTRAAVRPPGSMQPNSVTCSGSRSSLSSQKSRSSQRFCE